MTQSQACNGKVWLSDIAVDFDTLLHLQFCLSAKFDYFFPRSIAARGSSRGLLNGLNREIVTLTQAEKPPHRVAISMPRPIELANGDADKTLRDRHNRCADYAAPWAALLLLATEPYP